MKLGTFLSSAVIVLGLVNLVLFAFWLSVIRIDVLTPEKAALVYRFDSISFQLAMLETGGVFFGLVIAVLGFFGFQVVAERAEVKADRTAREVVMELDKRNRARERFKDGTGIPPNSVPPVNSVQVGGAQPEGDI
jgi:hypothetical protein